MRTANDLVSVIIPAFNAAETLDETLRSARGQSHRNLEILVVDDGSSDGTASIADRHAYADPRVRLIRQENRGLPATRNIGIANSSGAYIAPLDADDLWRSDKIERQLHALNGSEAALAYCWNAIIDIDGRIVHLDSRSEEEGDVIDALCSRNIVGNGSAPLVTRAAAEEVGGYDERKGRYGCEDYIFYFRIAQRHPFALVRDFLVGYRDRPDSMSASFDRMLDAHAVCEVEFGEGHPQRQKLLRANRTRLTRFMASRSFRGGNHALAGKLVKRMVREDPLGTLVNAADVVARKVKRAAGQRGPGAELLGSQFVIGDPDS
jgi:glycosyltransferase involved in cell wall biosynthesis